MTTRLSPEEKRERKKLFGTFSEGLRSIRPYRWQVERAKGELIEIPVTTMPIFKVPIHVSYILYLSVFSPALALVYFRLFLGLCRLTGVQPSLLLHPLDFLGGDDVEDLAFFPAMQLRGERKVRLVGDIIDLFSSQFTVVTMQQQAQDLSRAANFPIVKPNFESSQAQ
jgi:hypothetical protein